MTMFPEPFEFDLDRGVREFQRRTLAWVEANFSHEIKEKGWESARQLWEHIITCDSCDIFGDCPYIEDNPEKPMQGPPVPRELWSPIERMLFAAYDPQLRALADDVRFIAGYEQVSMPMIKQVG